ncbi:amine oxidase [Trametes versicolor FP-101664 SS1]|uniref:amine oxidase n=1 Tax=Trametes versicolor (strain FP-101664) TaxID=717944 RepID=UPI00046218CF|nr:amine oxidase [Trametes versicolor FP-101664 SS1]EIW56720.1 amine oxidase [Trametes versicolor FP-101664 SS1]
MGLVMLVLPGASAVSVDSRAHKKDASVLILGGGVAGVIAARTLHEQGITNFTIVEAKGELGGRLTSTTFGAKGKEVTLELGANWVQGTQTDDGPANPIWTLVQKHGLKTHENDWTGSIVTYNATGPDDFLDLFDESADAYTNLTITAGARVDKRLVDGTARTGYSLLGAKSRTPQAMASEYYQFDWEYAQTPEESSWIASSWGNNFTYNTDVGGFGDDNQMALDPRGFKYILDGEAAEFLQPSQLRTNSTVKTIKHSDSGVSVVLESGEVLHADYALCTFSLGVLQHDDVVFEPALPDWKEEAIQSMTMATYTKIFLQFEEKFWFDTEMALYADPERGRYPVWQSLDHENFLPGSGIVFVTTTGDYSLRVESLPDAQVQEEVLGVLAAMFPNTTIPAPVAFHFPRWNADPLFRGSYSNWPSSFFSEHHENLRANVGERLWFAGEATSQKYFGFLHGAYFEGVDVATEMAKCIKGGGCVGMKHVLEVTNARPYQI